MKIIEAMDRVLSTDVPQLMNMFPVERQEVLAATTAASAAAVSKTHISKIGQTLLK